MLVYIAAPFSYKDDLKSFRAELEERRIEVTSRWLDECAAPTATLDQFPDDYHLDTTNTDINDINRCNVLVLFTIDPLGPPKPRGGRHWETGYAYAKGKEIVIIGPRENIFHYLPDVKVFSTKTEALYYLYKRSLN